MTEKYLLYKTLNNKTASPSITFDENSYHNILLTNENYFFDLNVINEKSKQDIKNIFGVVIDNEYSTGAVSLLNNIDVEGVFEGTLETKTLGNSGNIIFTKNPRKIRTLKIGMDDYKTIDAPTYSINGDDLKLFFDKDTSSNFLLSKGCIKDISSKDNEISSNVHSILYSKEILSDDNNGILYTNAIDFNNTSFVKDEETSYIIFNDDAPNYNIGFNVNNNKLSSVNEDNIILSAEIKKDMITNEDILDENGKAIYEYLLNFKNGTLIEGNGSLLGTSDIKDILQFAVRNNGQYSVEFEEVESPEDVGFFFNQEDDPWTLRKGNTFYIRVNKIIEE